MKKAIALFLSMTMLLSLALVPAHAEDASSVELDLAQGSIVISATGYAQDGGAETPFTGEYTLIAHGQDKSSHWKLFVLDAQTHAPLCAPYQN